MDKRFSCIKCGKCCKNLLSKDERILRGLSLLPEEICNFPKTSIMPAIGLGSSPDEDDFRILVYQIVNDTCPNFSGKRCKIYDDRPTSCRQYPFSLSLDNTSKNILIGYDLNCPSLKKNLIAKSEKENYQEIKYAKRFLKVRLKMMLTKENIWFFDLQDKQWKQRTLNKPF
jgi:Fe-S-cluster containining protein